MNAKPFHLYLDSADRQALRGCLPHPLVHGVTTNPTLLKKAGLPRSELPALLHELLSLGVRQVQIQVESRDEAGMLADARDALAGFAPGQLVVKLPATGEGLAAAATLAGDGVPVTLTAAYALEQAHFGAQLGAAYVAPYLGRLEDSGQDGLQLIAQMQAAIERSGAGTRLLVASVRTPAAYRSLIALGVEAITVPPALFLQLMDHEATRAAEHGFLADAGVL